MTLEARLQELGDALTEAFSEAGCTLVSARGELTLEVPRDQLLVVMQQLHRGKPFQFEECMDVCGLDYATYGQSEWSTASAAAGGFSRGAIREAFTPDPAQRFAVVYHLLSVSLNHRVRVRTLLDSDDPIVDSVVGIWSSANWFEREAFDLYGILFDGHPDLRRILTDYGFIGHPFRKDFPLEGHVEMRYDPEQKRVIYEPVKLEARTLVPRVIRDDYRYDDGDKPVDEEADSDV
ncbi:MAG: NADH-quinone oxidoreductase subunit C [Pseudomonadota bacterium]